MVFLDNFVTNVYDFSNKHYLSKVYYLKRALEMVRLEEFESGACGPYTRGSKVVHLKKPIILYIAPLE